MIPDCVSDIGLIGCSRAKLGHPAPAHEMYCSPLFRMARAYVDRRFGTGCWMILSARYGLVGPDEVLEPYDLTLRQLTAVERRTWGQYVAAALRVRFGPATTLWFHAGALYRDAVIGLVPNPVRVPLIGMRIGEQLAWYRTWLQTARTAGPGGTASGCYRAPVPFAGVLASADR